MHDPKAPRGVPVQIQLLVMLLGVALLWVDAWQTEVLGGLLILGAAFSSFTRLPLVGPRDRGEWKDGPTDTSSGSPRSPRVARRAHAPHAPMGNGRHRAEARDAAHPSAPAPEQRSQPRRIPRRG